jgi:aminoglycoside phosphotransferase (APT) family kinase protein
VPWTLLLVTDESIIGRAFYVMEHVDGRIFWDQSLPGASSVERSAIYDEMNRVMARLHTVDIERAGLSDYGKAGNYFERQIGRWSKQYRASETETVEAMNRLIDWLPAHIPPGDETTVVHGDYRMDNLIFHPSEPRIIAILDWELSTLGHPLADFSYHCMSWHIPPGAFRGIAGLDHAALGIPSEADYIRRYAERTGRGAIEHWNFYLAYNLFRIARSCKACTNGPPRDSLRPTTQGRRAATHRRWPRSAGVTPNAPERRTSLHHGSPRQPPDSQRDRPAPRPVCGRPGGRQAHPRGRRVRALQEDRPVAGRRP